MAKDSERDETIERCLAGFEALDPQAQADVECLLGDWGVLNQIIRRIDDGSMSAVEASRWFDAISPELGKKKSRN